MQTYDTTPDRHQARNDAQILAFRDARPELYARLLAQLDPAERAALLARVAAAEAEKGTRP